MYMNVCGGVRVKVFLKILGNEPITFDNIASALRDFALSLRTNNPLIILSHKDELLNFVPYLRPSEVCLLAYGYQHVRFYSLEWWSKFSELATKTMYDMDGKEMAGLLYSFSKLDLGGFLTKKLNIIPQIVTELNHWTKILEPMDLSLAVRALSTLQIKNQDMFQRALELLDSFAFSDILFFINSSSHNSLKNMDFYKKVCHQSIKFVSSMDVKHIRTIASAISVGGIKSHQYFNILSKRLEQIFKDTSIQSQDYVSLLMSFTRQTFPLDSIMHIDPDLYKTTLMKLGEDDDSILNNLSRHEHVIYPLPSTKRFFEDWIPKLASSFNENDISIVARGISMLHLEPSKASIDIFFNTIAKNLEFGTFEDSKFANLVLSISTIPFSNNFIWQSLYNYIINKLEAPPEIYAKILTAVANSNNFSHYKTRVYTHSKKVVLSNLDKLSTRAISAICKTFEKTYDSYSGSNPKLSEEIIKRSNSLVFWDLSPILSMYSTLDICPNNVYIILKNRYESIRDEMNNTSRDAMDRLISKIGK